MVVRRWWHCLVLLYNYYIKHSVCQEVQVQQRPANPHLLFYGRLRNDEGAQVQGVQVQFWHADYNGNYFHPEDNLDGYELLHDTFSYFGTAETDDLGNFSFKTYRPGIYIGRPITHFHFKVFYKGQELLTSQFYFDDESASLMYDAMLVLKLQESVQADGTSFFYATKKVVVNMGMGGFEKLTPYQQEGPFYPVVNFFDVGNDMTMGLLSQLYGGTESPSDKLTDGSTTVLSLSQVPSFAPTNIKDGKLTTTNDSKLTNNDDDFVNLEGNEGEDDEVLILSDKCEEDESNGNKTATKTIVGDDDNDGDNDSSDEAISFSEDELPLLEDSPSDDIEKSPSSSPTFPPTTSKVSELDNNINTATKEPQLNEAPTSNPTIKPTENPKKPKPDNNANKTKSPTSNPTNVPTEKPKKSKPDDNGNEEKKDKKDQIEIPLEDNVSTLINVTLASLTIDTTTKPRSGSRFLRRNQ
mmetsp:Transcript_2975/g.3360  ORF Transcript_2975/g.3360 Transcript_2975/m.3360 type:complete len:468 (-) Transcript_2975:250-1653(-)